MDYTDRATLKFSKEELLDIALSLEIKNLNGSFDKHFIIDFIRQKVLQEGVPENSHYLLDDLVKTLKLFDNVYITLNGDFELPGCFGFTSDTDYHCNDCLLYQTCTQKLIQNLPDCYGILYDAIECKDCIVKDDCNVRLQGQVNTDRGMCYILEDIPILSNLLKALAQFRKFYQCWPSQLKVNKFNRLFNIKLRDIEIKKQDNLFLDFWYFVRCDGQEVTERQPVLFESERVPLKE